MVTKMSVSKKKKAVSVLFWLLLIIAGILLSTFVITFWGPISHDLTDWYEYSSFLAFIVSLVNLACFILLTYSAAMFQEDSHHKQMLAQKMELQTGFRKAHIDDIRKRMLELNELPTMKMDDDESFWQFVVKCKSLIRIFGIYENNNNSELFGQCDYKKINYYCSELNRRLESITLNKSTPTREDKIFLNDILGKINNEIMDIEKKLSDYTLQEVINAFKQE